jgi:hypothetical protein
VANKQIQFVLHEAARYMYTPGHEMQSVTTDPNGNYRIQIPPGCYGLEIPDMPGYWGCRIALAVISGPGFEMGEGWPYARTNGWSAQAVSTTVYDGNGFSANSGSFAKMDLYVNKLRYAVRTQVTEETPLAWRLLYRSPDGAAEARVDVSDCLETGARLILGGPGGGSGAIVRSSDGLCTVWTNLTGGSYSITGDTHDYLSSTTAIAFATFAWGDYPGQPPATEPPYGATLAQTPMPLDLFATATYAMKSVSPPTNSPNVEIIYANPSPPPATLTAYASPTYVAYAGLSNAVYNGSWVDRSRAQTYYVLFSSSGPLKVWAVPGGGPYSVNTLTQSPTTLPVAPYNMDVIAIATDNPGEEIADVPFRLGTPEYLTPRGFTNLTNTVSVAWSAGMPSAWIQSSIRYQVDTTDLPVHVLARMYCMPRVRVIGGVQSAGSGKPINEAVVEARKADGVGDAALRYETGESGAFTLSYAYSRGPYLLKYMAPGYLPFSRRVVLKDVVNGTNTSGTACFIADAGTQQLASVAVTVAKDDWDRRGSVLHGVQSAGNAEQPETSEAVQLTVSSSGSIPPQTYTVCRYDLPDGSPGGSDAAPWVDAITEVWLVDARYRDSNGDYQPYKEATGAQYYPTNSDYMPPATDPDKIRPWLDKVSAERQVVMKLRPPQPAATVAATGAVSVAELRAGSVRPALVACTRGGGYKILALETNLIDSVALPRWLAFAADVFAGAAAAQSAYDEMKETYASKIPDGRLSALPKLKGGISEEDGYLKYAYGLAVGWEEGAESPSKGGLSVGPGELGLKFEAEATVGFEGDTRSLTFEVGGKVESEDIDLQDYAPAFLEKIGIEGTINRVGGVASTRNSAALSGGQWTERELTTMVGAYIDLMLRYNLEGITGKLPYVGPLITLADATGALRLFGRLDMGGRVQSVDIWRTVEPNRAQKVGEPQTDRYVFLPPMPRPDDSLLTPSRHCFGGQENRALVYSNDFKLGVTFAAGFEGSALADHLNVHAGIEITGNSNDTMVAGQPSLMITPNRFGDWPPIRRVQGDVNAFINARLDAYVTEIEKRWTVNLARIDHQFTTESLLTMADLSVDALENPVDSTVFTGLRPTVVRNLPRGSSYAMSGNLLAFGMFNKAAARIDLVVSLAAGDGFASPTTVASNVVGLGLIRLAELGAGRRLLIWEERPGIGGQSEAYSVLHAAPYDGIAWQPGQTVVELRSYLIDMELFSSTSTNSLVYLQSPDNYLGTRTSIRAVGYNAGADAWGHPATVRPLAEKRDAALACAGWHSPEPGRVVYAPGDAGMASIYWDGVRSHTPTGNVSRQVTSADSRRVAICSGGTNDALYVTSLRAGGFVELHRYAPDPLRDPGNPDYDWNGRDDAATWPHVGTLTVADDGADDLANGWLPGCGRLLSVWSHVGSLDGNWVDPGNPTGAVDTAITANQRGVYRDVRIAPISNGFARVAARFVSAEAHELRVFVVEAGTTDADEDVDGDGCRDALEQALVDADPEDGIHDIRDVAGTADFDGDGFDNATEWAHGTRADLAGDGIPNDLELALGLRPLVPDPLDLRMTVEGGMVRFLYTYDPEVEEALLSILRGTNLMDTSWDPSGASCVRREARADGLEDVYSEVPTNGPIEFFRLQTESIAP